MVSFRITEGIIAPGKRVGETPVAERPENESSLVPDGHVVNHVDLLQHLARSVELHDQRESRESCPDASSICVIFRALHYIKPYGFMPLGKCGDHRLREV